MLRLSLAPVLLVAAAAPTRAFTCDPSSWPDLDTHVCGTCKALVNWEMYGSTCSDYCSGIGLTCVDGWEEVGDDGCTEGENLGCDRWFSRYDTSDAICECAGPDEDNFWACRQSNCPCSRGLQFPEDWGSDATVDINYVRTNAYIAAAVNCICASCGHYDIIKDWPAYAAGVCGVAQTVVADGSAASQVVLSYFLDSTCAATRTMTRAFPDGVCFDPQTAGLAGRKFSCSADGATFDLEVYGADPNCQGAGDAGVNYSPTLTQTYNGSVFAVPTPGCYLTADPTAPGQYTSVECFGPDYNSDMSMMSCGAPSNTVDANQTTSRRSTNQTTSRRSRALFAVVVAVAVAVCLGAGAAAAVTVLGLRASSAKLIQEAGEPSRPEATVTRIHPTTQP